MAEIRVLPRKNPLQFLIFKRPVATVAGQVHELRWGAMTTISLPEGAHELQIHFPYFGREAGKASLTVQAGTPGPIVRYRTPFIVTSAGKVSVDQGPRAT